jgi:hypothetical protein
MRGPQRRPPLAVSSAACTERGPIANLLTATVLLRLLRTGNTRGVLLNPSLRK